MRGIASFISLWGWWTGEVPEDYEADEEMFVVQFVACRLSFDVLRSLPVRHLECAPLEPPVREGAIGVTCGTGITITAPSVPRTNLKLKWEETRDTNATATELGE